LNLTISKDRTDNYLKQLKASFLFKVLAIGASFLIIPIMIRYLGNEQYGIWSTLLSIISWIVLFDIGIGNSLRNKISEALVKDDKKKARDYISTAYVLIGLISVVLLISFLIASSFIPWQRFFNTSILSNHELESVVNITASFLFINFWLSLINQVFNGIQKTSFVVFNQFLSNTLALIFTYVLYLYFETSLWKLAFVYGSSLLLSSLLLSLWFYRKNQEFIPQVKYYVHKYTKSITSLGFQFFIIQIAVVAIFTTDKILITQLFSPEYVTSYDVVFKLFSVITIAHSLLMAPLWSAYSDAYHREDFGWIKRTIKNQLKIYLLIVLATIGLIFLAKPVISIWIGKDFVIDNTLIIVMGLFVLVSTWNNIYAYFLNATNKLDTQIKTSIIAIFINIPLSIILVKYLGFGMYGVVIGTILSLSLFAIFGPLQTYRILKGK
jgi:O-antigen/teichoic acid export membrane protein